MTSPRGSHCSAFAPIGCLDFSRFTAAPKLAPPASESLCVESIGHQGHEIGEGSPVFVIAEIAQAHDGSLGTAHAYIDAVAAAGATAVKFQTHIADCRIDPGGAVPRPILAARRHALRLLAADGIHPRPMARLADHARQRGLVFLSTPVFARGGRIAGAAGRRGLEGRLGRGEQLADARADGRHRPAGFAVQRDVFVARFGSRPWSASARPGPAGRDAMHDRLSLSAGKNRAERVGRAGRPLRLSGRPVRSFRNDFPSLSAVTLGAKVLEVHVVLSRECFGPDVPASITTAELAQLVAGTRFIETDAGSSVGQRADGRRAERLADACSAKAWSRRAICRPAIR